MTKTCQVEAVQPGICLAILGHWRVAALAAILYPAFGALNALLNGWAMVSSLHAHAQAHDRGRGTVYYVDISSFDYDPSRNMGVTYEDAMDTIHAIRSSGEVLRGTDALKALFNAVGLAWVVKLADLPIIAGLVDLVYNNLAAHRLRDPGSGAGRGGGKGLAF
eukprot:1148720-Pelagomonas_calceolata.AAC.1